MPLLRLVVLFLSLMGSFPVKAEGRVTGADLLEIRTVINRQLDAFKRDDATGAFALASPDVQQAFGTPQRFLDAVRMAYRAVYRPARVAFLEPTVLSGDVVWQLQIIDRSGSAWLAYYSMQRQEDGSWRASGCHLVQPARTISASFQPY